MNKVYILVENYWCDYVRRESDVVTFIVDVYATRELAEYRKSINKNDIIHNITDGDENETSKVSYEDDNCVVSDYCQKWEWEIIEKPILTEEQ